MFTLKTLKFFRTAILEPTIAELSRENCSSSREIKIVFEKLKSNRNLHRIPFKMMHNMSMLRHKMNWMNGGALNHLPLFFCKRMYKHHLQWNNAAEVGCIKKLKKIFFEMEQSVVPMERILQQPLCMQYSLSMNKSQLYQGSWFSYCWRVLYSLFHVKYSV